MTDQEQIIALAKLDGYIRHPAEDFNENEGLVTAWIKGVKTRYIGAESNTFEYHTSRDALWPLIQNLNAVEFIKYEQELSNYCEEQVLTFQAFLILKPEQLACALLKAKGLWG